MSSLPRLLAAPLALLAALTLAPADSDAQSTQATTSGAADEAPAVPPTVNSTVVAGGTSRNAGTNPNSLTFTLPPQIGLVMFGQLDFQSTGHPFGFVFGYLPPTTLTLPGGQTLLADITDPAGPAFPLLPADPFTGLFLLPIPNDPTLCGIQVSMQGLHWEPVLAIPFVLSNALDMTVGI